MIPRYAAPVLALIEENAYDRDFVDRYTTGFNKVEATSGEN